MYWIIIAIFLLGMGVLIITGRKRLKKTKKSKFPDIIYHIVLYFKNTKLEKRTLELINSERNKEGLKSLKIDKLATEIAEQRCKEIIIKFSHVGLDIERTVLIDAGADGFGENLAKGHTFAEGVVRAWMKSPGHKAAILNPSYDAFGLKVLKNSEGIQYWANIFINDNKIE